MDTRYMNADQMLTFARGRLRALRERRRRGHLYMLDQQPSIETGIDTEGGGGGGGPDSNLDEGDIDSGSGTMPDGSGWDAFDAGSDGASSDGGGDSSGGADDGDDDGGDDGGTVSPFDGQATNSQQQTTLAILPAAQGGGGGGSGQGSTSLAAMLGGLMGYGG